MTVKVNHRTSAAETQPARKGTQKNRDDSITESENESDGDAGHCDDVVDYSSGNDVDQQPTFTDSGARRQFGESPSLLV
jgi:hypothetical protein